MKKDLIILNLFNITFLFIIRMMTPRYLSINVVTLMIVLNLVLIVIQLKVKLKLIVLLKYLLFIMYAIYVLIKPNAFFIPVVVIHCLFIFIQFLWLYIELKLQKLNRCILPLFQYFVGITFIMLGLVFYDHALFLLNYRASDFVPGMELKYQITGIILIAFGIISIIFTRFKRIFIMEKDLIILNLLNINLMYILTPGPYKDYMFIWFLMILIIMNLIIIQNKVNIKIWFLKYLIPLFFSLYILIEDAYEYFKYHYTVNGFIVYGYLIDSQFIIFGTFIILQCVFIYIESKLHNYKEKILIIFKYVISLQIVMLGLRFYQQAQLSLSLSGAYIHGMEIKYQVISYCLVIIGLIGIVYTANKNKLLALNLFNILFMIIITRYDRLGSFYNTGAIFIMLYLLAVFVQSNVKSRWIVIFKYLIPMGWPFYIFINHYSYDDLTNPLFLAYLVLLLTQCLFIYIEFNLHKNKDQILPLLILFISISCILQGIFYRKFDYYIPEFIEPYKNASYTLLIMGRILLFLSILMTLFLKLFSIYKHRKLQEVK